jgi:hypothetical protein
MTDIISTPKTPDTKPASPIATDDQPCPKKPKSSDDEKAKQVKIWMFPPDISMLDDLVKSRGFKSRNALLVALMIREREDPMDGLAEQIGHLNAMMFKLVAPEAKAVMTKAERTELLIDLRRLMGHIRPAEAT